MPINSLPTYPLVHGHRGCRGLLPENTLPAFLHALALGVEVLELDVVISQDRQVVVSHEPWLAAQLGTGPAGELIDATRERTYNLYQLPYATIKQCAVGLWPHPNFPAQRPVATYRPLLAEVLQHTLRACEVQRRPPVKYAVELKCSPAGDGWYHPLPADFARLVVAELFRAGVLDRTTLLSFDHRVLQAIRQQAPTLPLCYLVENQAITERVFDSLGFVPEVFGPDYQLLSDQLVQQLRASYPTLQLVPWTINGEQAMARALRWPLAGITTDFPDQLLQMRNQEV